MEKLDKKILQGLDNIISATQPFKNKWATYELCKYYLHANDGGNDWIQYLGYVIQKLRL